MDGAGTPRQQATVHYHPTARAMWDRLEGLRYDTQIALEGSGHNRSEILRLKSIVAHQSALIQGLILDVERLKAGVSPPVQPQQLQTSLTLSLPAQLLLLSAFVGVLGLVFMFMK